MLYNVIKVLLVILGGKKYFALWRLVTSVNTFVKDWNICYSQWCYSLMAIKIKIHDKL